MKQLGATMALLSCWAFPACSWEQEVSLEKYRASAVHATVSRSDAVARDAASVQVTLESSHQAESRCPVLAPDVSASLNGEPLGLQASDGTYASRDLDLHGCYSRTVFGGFVALSPLATEPQLLAIEDATARIEIRARTLHEAHGPADVALAAAPGERVRLPWLPETDDLTKGNREAFLIPDPDDALAPWIEIAVTGGVGFLEIALPHVLVDEGGAPIQSAVLRVFADASIPVEGCVGVPSCHLARAWMEYSLPVEILQ